MSFYEIRCAAEAIGLRALSFKISAERLRDIVALPVIIHWRNNHFVVVYDIDDAFFYIADPAKGKVKYNFDTVKMNGYSKPDNKGVVMIFEPLKP